MTPYLSQDVPKKYISTILVLFSFLTYNNIMSLNAQQPPFSKNSELFAFDVYETLKDEVPNKNLIFSPFSIQSSVAMVRMGAEGKTAEELNQGLRLVSGNTSDIADSFSSELAEYVDSKVLRIANKIYFKKGYTVRKEFNEILTKKFFSTAEEINFAEDVKAAGEINGWVASKTNNLIKDLVSPQDLNSLTRFVLLNAIHFKGVWKTKFLKNVTEDADFFLNESDTVKVPMMSVFSEFQYAEYPEFDASALEMPYADTDLSMLIFLPNSRTGLKALERKLEDVQLSAIASMLSSRNVTVKIPKFKTDVKLELRNVLTKLGMPSMFSGSAELGKMFEKSESLSVSKVIHQAFIEVNEEGTEAAASTGAIGREKSGSGGPTPRRFIANRPFLYVIRSKSGPILFAGSYINAN